MADYRAERIGDEMMNQLGRIIPTLKDPRIAGKLVSVTRVSVSGDGRNAKIFISVLGDDASLKETLKGFASSTGFIRRELAGAMRLRYTPELLFVADTGLARGQKTIELMRDLEKEERQDS